MEYLYDQEKSLHQDSVIASLADWAVLCLQTGFRISQYAQAHSALHMNTYSPCAKNIDVTTKAFIRSDFQFKDANKQPVPTNRRYLDKFVHIKSRFQ